MKKLISLLALGTVLMAGLAWCGGPCCAPPNGVGPSLSVGAIPCCNDSSDPCQPSLRPVRDVASAPHAPTLPTVTAFGLDTAAPIALASSPLAASARRCLPRPDLLRLDVPLLI